MNQLQKRSLLYGSAVLALSTIGVAMATVDHDADVMTLLSSADVQLRMAYAIPPEADTKGPDPGARLRMVTEAEQYLASVERREPGKAVTAEFMGFAAMLRGRYDDAAAHYDRARQCADCGDEQRDVLTFNQARMLAKAGRREQALAVFAAAGAALDARFGSQRSLEEATILRELGRRVDPDSRLDQVCQKADVPPMASLQAGLEYVALGHEDKAQAAFERAAKAIPIADYHLAALKLRRGEVDTCLTLLERVSKTQLAEVRRRIREEPDAWRAVADLPRFRELSAEQSATPSR